MVTKYFESPGTHDRESKTHGVLYLDAHLVNGFRKKYGGFDRTYFESLLVTSYRNRIATLSDVTVTSNGKIYNNGKYVGIIVGCGCEAENGYENPYVDKTVHEHVITLSGIWSYGIWHFPCEALCALMDQSIPPDAKIHVHTRSPYVLSWLQMIGITPDRVLHGTISAKTLRIPEQGMCGAPYPEQIDWLSTLINESVERLPYKLLIVSRRTKTRELANFSAVYDAGCRLANKLGLLVYVHDDSKLPSLKMQHQAFKNAQVVIAPHGGGNVHVLAMDEGSTLIEIIDLGYINKCFLRLALHKNVNYFGVNSAGLIADTDALNAVCEIISKQ